MTTSWTEAAANRLRRPQLQGPNSLAPLALQPERAVLVGAEVRRGGNDPGTSLPADETFTRAHSLQELAALARTAGAEVVGTVAQRLDRPHPATYIGSGKVEALRDLLVETDADLAIFDIDLSPSQQRNLEERLMHRVVDRTALILDIFAQRAQTHEGQLQVELAQLEYLLPRLSQLWVRFSRLGGAGAGAGGGGGRIATRGPGETQLETDRRMIGRRIATLKRKIAAISTQRGLYRTRRKAADVPIVALIGYTNAGKSTLLRALADADVLVEDKLFATLDPTTRRVRLPGGQHILLTDTVGFIRRLPTTLIAAFRATLEEVEEADVLVHVVDVAHPHMREQIAAVGQTLNDLEITAKPVITALNKIDLLPPAAALPATDLPNAVAISAAQGHGLAALLETVQNIVTQEDQVRLRVRIPYRESQLVQLFHSRGTVLAERYDSEGTALTGTIPQRFAAAFHPYRV